MCELDDELDPPFEILEPAELARAGHVQFAAQRQRLSARVPRGIAARYRRRCAAPRIRFVDELIAGVVERGYPLMRAHFPRCYVDVNREPYELDPRMFEGRLPSFANTRSMRVAGGLGHGRARRRRRPGNLRPAHSGRRRAPRASRACTSPITARCGGCSRGVHRDFGAAVLIDCHSMPSTAGAKDERPRADLVLGDRYGTSCVAVDRRDGRSDARAARAIRSAATSPMPAASSPSITAIRPPACMRSSSRSTARSTWTSGASSARRISRALAADIEALADRLAAIPLEELRPYRAAAE